MKLRKALEKAKLERRPPPRPEEKKAAPESPTKHPLDLALSPPPLTPAGKASPASSLPAATSGTSPAPKGLDPVSPVIPQPKYVTLDFKKAYDNRCVCFSQNAPEIEAYKMLRAQIQQRIIQNKGWHLFMVTSALPREGKTLTAINLAVRFAKAYDQPVLLVDCDFKHQQIHEYLGYPSQAGLIDYLTGDMPLGQLITHTWGIENFSLISGGSPAQEDMELINTPRMHALLRDLKTHFDDRFIFFDMPPVLTSADTLSLASMVDGIIMVVESGKTPIKDLRKAMDALPPEKIAGFVLNRHAAL